MGVLWASCGCGHHTCDAPWCAPSPQAYPSNLSTLTSLETLAITQVSEFIPILPPLPAGLSELTSLSSLIIEGAAFADGYPHCVQSMKQLTQLVLRGEWGVIVPPIEGLRQLKWLEVCTGILDAQVCEGWVYAYPHTLVLCCVMGVVNLC